MSLKGNMCFGFVSPIVDKQYPPLNIKEFNNSIIERSFRNMKIGVESKGRNDMTLDGKKFSGSAFEVSIGGKNAIPRVLHHGTILLDVDLESMCDYLNPNVLKLKSKVLSKGS